MSVVSVYRKGSYREKIYKKLYIETLYEDCHDWHHIRFDEKTIVLTESANTTNTFCHIGALIASIDGEATLKAMTINRTMVDIKSSLYEKCYMWKTTLSIINPVASRQERDVTNPTRSGTCDNIFCNCSKTDPWISIQI